MRETDPKRKAELLREYQQDKLRTTRDLARPRTSEAWTAPTPAAPAALAPLASPSAPAAPRPRTPAPSTLAPITPRTIGPELGSYATNPSWLRRPAALPRRSS